MTTTVLNRVLPAALTLAIALVPIAAGPADAASKRRKHKAKQTTTRIVTPKRASVNRPAPAAAATPAPVAAPTFTSVIAIGGYDFYNLTYAEAVEAYTAAVAAAPAGYTPPPVTSVSVTTTVGSSG